MMVKLLSDFGILFLWKFFNQRSAIIKKLNSLVTFKQLLRCITHLKKSITFKKNNPQSFKCLPTFLKNLQYTLFLINYH